MSLVVRKSVAFLPVTTEYLQDLPGPCFVHTWPSLACEYVQCVDAAIWNPRTWRSNAAEAWA